MKMRKPSCAHCGTTVRKLNLYWSARNLIEMPMKTYYCEHCARIIVPGQEPVKLGDMRAKVEG